MELTEWHSDPPPAGTEHQDIELARISRRKWNDTSHPVLIRLSPHSPDEALSFGTDGAIQI
jgi:hypothetical protein